VHVKVAIASDHGGFRLKEVLKPILDDLQVTYEDLGTVDESSVDYPDYAIAVAEAVRDGRYDFGVLVCGTGLGMAITANKVMGIRAVTVHDVFSAQMARAHNDANILTLGERVVGPGVAEQVLRTFLTTEFAAGRHARRVNKIREVERKAQTNAHGDTTSDTPVQS